MFTQGTAPQKLNQSSTEKRAPLGAMLVDENGRIFRYARASATAITGGTLCQATDQITSSHVLGKLTAGSNVGLATGANRGTKSVRHTATTTSFAENFFREGVFANVISSAGIAIVVDGHPASTASAACQLTFKDPAGVVFSTGASRGILFPNPFDGVLICAAAYARPPICVPQQDIGASEYFWGLVNGFGIGRYDGTLIEGMPVVPSLSVAGAVITIADDLNTLTAGGRNATHVIGQCLAFASGQTHGCLINWRL